MSIRGSSFELMSRNRSTLPACKADDWADVPALNPPLAAAVLGVELGATFISLNVFHCPQAGHLPIHFGDSCPQFEQTYAILSFAIMCAKVIKKAKKRSFFSKNQYLCTRL
jgi:hypothetical protein